MVSTPVPDPKMLDCPALVTIQLVSGKWKTRVLWHLRQGGAGFGDLRRAMPGISAKVLTEHLDALVADGLLARTESLEGKVLHTRYRFSDYGFTLIPVLDALGSWGLNHAERAAGHRFP
ncbi:winged helix-turn-helix transcriptional regulator [Oryzicola mucosus]|uniref:Helix-turn-helix transcriptional regulator n=1 Tax=Oryzicola mucosus TaxID=2767425 RepID=A0A8J6U3L7_9HYPH|nr:helix-turn-helix domain-containing protein [Oryzicola mucosus]MBD0416998.1 helix-turn-helix transcriptional regulator [Oryzicola mucosus]